MKDADKRWTQLEEPVPGEDVVRELSDQYFIIDCQIGPGFAMSRPRTKIQNERDVLMFSASLRDAITQV
jgi:hypothetical protein